MAAKAAAVVDVANEPPDPQAEQRAGRDEQPQELRLGRTRTVSVTPCAPSARPGRLRGCCRARRCDLGTMMFNLFGAAPFGGRAGMSVDRRQVFRRRPPGAVRCRSSELAETGR